MTFEEWHRTQHDIQLYGRPCEHYPWEEHAWHARDAEVEAWRRRCIDAQREAADLRQRYERAVEAIRYTKNCFTPRPDQRDIFPKAMLDVYDEVAARFTAVLAEAEAVRGQRSLTGDQA